MSVRTLEAMRTMLLVSSPSLPILRLKPQSQLVIPRKVLQELPSLLFSAKVGFDEMMLKVVTIAVIIAIKTNNFLQKFFIYLNNSGIRAKSQ